MKVLENALQIAQMRFPGIIHVQADLLNSIRNIWSGEGEILKGTSDTAIVCRVGDCDTISKELGVSIHRGAAGLAVEHTSTFQNIQHILTLGEKQTVMMALNTDSEEMMKRSHVHH